jgi:hypothetical protein
MEAHWEGLPMVARPGRSTPAVAGSGGQRWCQRGRRVVGCWCGACGGEAGGWGASSLVLLAPWWCFGGGGDEGATTVASKMSQHGVGGGGEGVPAAAVTSKSQRGQRALQSLRSDDSNMRRN